MRNGYCYNFIGLTLLLVIGCALSSYAALADTPGSCSEEKKVYDGNYIFKGINGHAKYQYLTASDGTRIYDGDFEFRGDNFIVYGRFKDDCQVGAWNYSLGGISTTVHFDTSGYLSGEFSIHDEDTSCKGSCSGGSVSYISYRDNNIYTEGRCNAASRYNKPIGTWKLTILYDPDHLFTNESNFGNEPMTVLFDENGSYKGWYFLDPSTGDKKEPQRGRYTSYGPESILRRVLLETNEKLSIVLFRESIRKNGYDM